MTKAGSRTSKGIRNSAVAMGYYAVSMLLQFFSRKVFLDCLGTEVLGLNTTAMNLLQFLNLAELGISQAVGFTLFKPLHDNDMDSVREIVSLQGKLYARIAWIIIGGSAVLMAFFPLIFAKMQLPLWYAYASFVVLLFSALLGYFVNFKQIALSASQQEYKIFFSYKTVNLIKILCQMWAVSYFDNGYVWWILLEALFGIFASIALHIVTVRNFPGLTSSKKSFRELNRKYHEFTVKVKQLFFHKIGTIVMTQTSPLIVYAFTTLTSVALYGNYLIVASGVQVLGGTMFGSLSASVGDLVAEGNKEKSLRVLFELFSFRFYSAVLMCFITYMVTQDFITLWIGKQYLLPNLTLALIVGTLYVNLVRYAIDVFVNAFGLFKDIWAPVAEASINISFSVLFGYFWGLNGVLAGVLLSLVVMIVSWKPYFLFRNHFPGKYHLFMRVYAVHLLCGVAAWAICMWVIDSLPEIGDTWTGLIGKALLCMILFGGVLLAFQCVARTGIVDFMARFGIRLGKRTRLK